MAVLHQATLTPSKLEILSAYLRTLPTLAAAAGSRVAVLGAYRFDDPAGEVGIETHLLAGSKGVVIQIPLTHRGSPLAGAEEWLVATMDHSVLGTRWVYNACGDPVYVTQLISVILTGGTQVEQYVETPEGPIVRDPTATVIGSGSPDTPVPPIDSVVTRFEATDTAIQTGEVEIELVVRHLLDGSPPPERPKLTGVWAGADAPTTLAFIR